MRKQPVIVVAPDSFKGSMSAIDAAAAMRAGVLRAAQSAEVRVCPMADGGEGTLEAVLSVGGHTIVRAVRDASGFPRPTELGILAGGQGLVEVAKIVGLTDAQGTRTPVKERTTAGVGEAILHLLDFGCSEIFIALGGSSTNDGGFGMLAALGLLFVDAHGDVLSPTPSVLNRIASVEVGGLNPQLRNAKLTAMSDVSNPLSGPEGATAVFGPQKGVLPQDWMQLDAQLSRVAKLLEREMRRSASGAAGAGAAGGLGFAIQVLGGESRSGAATVGTLLHLDGMLKGADLVLTGEGKSDAQTLQGKAPFWIAGRAAEKGVPIVLLSGSVDQTALPDLKSHFTACLSITAGPVTLADAMSSAASLLANQAEQIVRIFLQR